jgi:shikimate kinase
MSLSPAMELRTVFLVGFMGAGKTRIGQLLAKHLSQEFHDVDSEIEAKAGMPIHELVAQKSYAHFRECEREWLINFEGSGVVACGGGLVCYNNLMDALKKRGHVIYLKASAKTLWDRISRKNAQHRILLRDFKSFAELLESRESIYESAHQVLETQEYGPEEVALQCYECLAYRP